jgi:nucleotide-binding universal stress UspA family protein
MVVVCGLTFQKSRVADVGLPGRWISHAHSAFVSDAQSPVIRLPKPLTCRPSLGEPCGVILDTAKKWGADLIVLGSHGRRGLDRFLLGSVSEAVAIHAACSVQVVRGRQYTKSNGLIN